MCKTSLWATWYNLMTNLRLGLLQKNELTWLWLETCINWLTPTTFVSS